ncbi:MAG TPA: hypothetical protein VD767_03760 [Thermomicrobiales bacterium]|nr:hypothetical protein [Thermomicrobiales bacterium]
MPAQDPNDQPTDTPVDVPAAGEAPASTDDASVQAEPGAPGDTVGTGSVIALGCIGGTIFLIVLGLIYLLVVQVFG